MEAPQPEPQQAWAPEAAMHDAAAPSPGPSPPAGSRQPSQAPVDSRQPSQAPADSRQPSQAPVDSRQPSQAPAEPPQPRHQEGPSDGANGTHSPASAPSGSGHSTPGLQPLPLPLPPLSAPASAPPLPPGPVPRPSASSSPRTATPVPGSVPTGDSPVAGPYHGHHGHQPPPPTLPPVTHYQQPPLPPLHGLQQLPPMKYPPQPPPVIQGKVAIVEPPMATRRASGTKFPGLQSPGRDHARVNPKFNEDVSRLTHAVKQSLPEAVRHVTREHWDKTLLGSDYHLNFVMSAGFLHSNTIALQRAVGENGHKMVSRAKREIVHHLGAADLDVVADAILAKASDNFLDKALEIRLATIDARSLINALARNGRLGYEPEEESNAAPVPASAQQPAPHLQPTHSPPTAHPTHMPAQVQPNPMPNPSQPSGSPLRPLQSQQGGPGSANHRPPQCHRCWRKFQTVSAYEFHTKKRVCTKVPPDASGYPFNCPFCGTGFVTAVGKNYHHMNKVCGDHGMAPATPRAPTSPIVLSSGTNSPVRSMPPSATPQKAPPASQAVPSASMSQPVQQRTPYRTSPGHASTPLSSQKTPSDDPYSHLKPETREKLEEELRLAEMSYRPRFQQCAKIADANERLKRQEGLQNSFSTKQSIIRKKYGVRLRQRRTKAEIEAERERVTGTTTVFSRKRQRTDSDPPSGPLPEPMDATPTPPLSVGDMNSAGLGGPGATVATADPTVEQQTPSRAAVPHNSLGAYQRNGYRVSTHVPVGSRPPSSHFQDAPIADTSIEVESRRQSPDPKRGSPASPIVSDVSSSDSESDADEDIPATLPPGKAQSNSSTRGLAG